MNVFMTRSIWVSIPVHPKWLTSGHQEGILQHSDGASFLHCNSWLLLWLIRLVSPAPTILEQPAVNEKDRRWLFRMFKWEEPVWKWIILPQLLVNKLWLQRSEWLVEFSGSYITYRFDWSRGETFNARKEFEVFFTRQCIPEDVEL
jgi:hypothetical protein